jgi:hypothetical protein
VLHVWGSVLNKGRNYSLLHSDQTGSVAHSASDPMGNAGIYFGSDVTGISPVQASRTVQIYISTLTTFYMAYLKNMISFASYLSLTRVSGI